MATNRMYLFCKRCGAHFYLAKYLVEPWSATFSTEELDEFFKEHFGMVDMCSDTDWEIRFENCHEDRTKEVPVDCIGHKWERE